MEYLEIPKSTNGSIERFGATTKLNDEILTNFADRGALLARLVEVTLTETPYTPTIDNQRFEKTVSNRYAGYGDDGASSDTVEEARDILAEFLSADVDGARRVKLETFSTNYLKLMNDVLPGRRTSKSQKETFEESLVVNTRRRGIEVASPKQALEIIQNAPKTIDLLRLTANVPTVSYRTETNEAVTEAGRMITTLTSKRISLLGDIRSDYLPTTISSRGGTAPGSTISHQIQRRIIDLRTKHTKR